MLVKLGNKWVDPTTVRIIGPANYGADTAVRFKRFGDMQQCAGIKVDDAARIINEALSNPLFYDPEV